MCLSWDYFTDAVAERLSGGFVLVEIQTSVSNGKLLSWINQYAEEVERSYQEDGSKVRFKVRMAKQLANSIDHNVATVNILQPVKT